MSSVGATDARRWRQRPTPGRHPSEARRCGRNPPLRARPRQRMAKQRTECSVCRTSPCAAASFRRSYASDYEGTRRSSKHRPAVLQRAMASGYARSPSEVRQTEHSVRKSGPDRLKRHPAQSLAGAGAPYPADAATHEEPCRLVAPCAKKAPPLREAPSRIFTAGALRSRPQRPARARRSPRSAAKCYSASERLGRPPPFASARSRCTASRKRWNSSVFASSS